MKDKEKNNNTWLEFLKRNQRKLLICLTIAFFL